MRTTFMNIAIHYRYMTTKREQAPGVHEADIRLFSTWDAVVAVDSPVKVRILELVSSGPVPFDVIVERTGKAKSTISVHVHDLIQSGLVISVPDPLDSRRRVIMLSSDAIGRLTNTDRHIANIVQAYSGDGDEQTFRDEDIVSFFRFCVLVFRTQAMALGINIDPVLERTGQQVGMVLARRVAGDTPGEVVEKMDAFWKSHGLGSIMLASRDPLTLEVKGCFECEDLPETGHGACVFDIGVLTAIFSYHLERPVRVVEERCYSSGDGRCIFVIIPINADI
jgi:predicted hydrocarbon binding protein